MLSLSVWEPEPNLATLRRILDHRGRSAAHRVVHPAEIDQLVDFGNLLGVELLIIDGATNRREVAVRIE
jgi:hypothetical protein